MDSEASGVRDQTKGSVMNGKLELKDYDCMYRVVNETICLYLRGKGIIDAYLVLNIEDTEKLANLMRQGAEKARDNRNDNNKLWKGEGP
jgi:hypothetical protein